MEHSDFGIELVKESLTTKIANDKTPKKYGKAMAQGLESIRILESRIVQLQGRMDTQEIQIPVTKIRQWKKRLVELAFHNSTPKKYATVMLDTAEIINQLFRKIKKLEKDTAEPKPERICLNCNYMENMDCVHGCGICTVLEGETVLLDCPCICPKEILEDTERLLASVNNQEEKNECEHLLNPRKMNL